MQFWPIKTRPLFDFPDWVDAVDWDVPWISFNGPWINQHERVAVLSVRMHDGAWKEALH